MFGTNGGGFFNANSAHPFENPTALTNLVQMLLIFSIGAALTNVFGRMVGNQRQGWALFAVMGLLFLAGVSSPTRSRPAATRLRRHARRQRAGALQAGGNMEGKEVRFGIANSALFATVTTDTSCGAVNTMHDSLLPLAGMMPMVNIMLGEVIFGGVGSGLYGMLAFAIIAVFVAGLMVGRTPEYLGKKIEAKEVKMAMLAILILPLSILGFTALAVVVPAGTGALSNAGPHGFSEALYAYTSATGNNGSAFAGLTRQRAVLERDARHRHAGRPLPVHHPRAGGRRLAGRQEDRARLGRHLPDRWRPVRRPRRRRDPDRRRADLLPGPRPRPRRRAPRDARRHCVLTRS